MITAPAPRAQVNSAKPTALCAAQRVPLSGKKAGTTASPDMNSPAAAIDLPSGGRLAGAYHTGHNDSAFAVVWVHGFGSHRGGEKSEAVQQECARRRWAFAAFDFRGHGESSGAMHELRASRLVEDLGAIRDWLAARGHVRLGLIGSSMGGFAAAWFARQHPDAVLGCVFAAPGFGFLDRRWDELTPEQREEWRRAGRMRLTNQWVDAELGFGLVEERDRFRPVQLVAGWRTPALLFHGLADEVVPHTDSLFFIRHVGYPRVELRLLKDGDHRLTAHKEAIASAAGAFFAGLLEGGGRGARG